MNKLRVTIDGHSFEIDIDMALACDGTEFTALVDGTPLRVTPACQRNGQSLDWVVVEGRPYEVAVDRELRWLRSRSGLHRLEVSDRGEAPARVASGDGRIKAPIPGMITRLFVRPGDEVKAGQPLLVLEAMKMENEIRAGRNGVVSQVSVAEGQGVTLHQVLAEIA